MVRVVRASDPVELFLLVAGLGAFGLSGSWVLQASRGRELAVDWIPTVTPSVVGVGWAVVGTLCLAAVLGMPVRLAFVALTAWLGVVGALFGVSWGIAMLPERIMSGGNSLGLSSLIIYWAAAAGVLTIAELWDERTAARARELAHAKSEGA